MRFRCTTNNNSSSLLLERYGVEKKNITRFADLQETIEAGLHWTQGRC